MSGFKSILIVGSTGFCGEKITKAFLSSTWSVSLLVGSKSLNDPKKKPVFDKYSSQGAKIIVGDVDKPETYKDQLKGIDVVISALGNQMLQHQPTLAVAAKDAGVKLFAPSEFGFDITKFKGHPMFDSKLSVREALEKTGINVTYIETGPFYEFFYAWPSWGVDVANKTVTQIEPHSTRVWASPFEEVAGLLPNALNDPSIINKTLRLGRTTTTGEIYDLAIEALGGKDKVHIKSETLADLENQISNQFVHERSIMWTIATERSFTTDLEDGTKYGKRLSSISEFAPAFLRGVIDGSYHLYN